jgi:Zn-dependent membrane protease YugP
LGDNVILYWAIILGLPFVALGWVKWQLNRYNRVEMLPGSGKAIAEHFIKGFGLTDVRVEVSPLPDHYDPVRKCIVLNEQWGHRATVTSVAIATHEFGHAMQDHLQEAAFLRHSRVMRWTHWIRHLSQAAFLGLLALSWLPGVFKLMLLLLILAALLNLVLHACVLPVEWDASFRKALPLLQQGGYLPAKQLRQARKVLMAAAFTYLAGAIVDIFNFRLLMLLVRR